MSTNQRPPLWLLALFWLITVGAFALGIFVAKRSAIPEPQATAMQVVLQEIVRSHVEEQDPHRLADIAIKAMASFDHYGQYVPAAEVDGYVEATTGNYAGIGVATLPVPGKLLVKFPFQGGPAARAGLLPGDEIVAVGDTRIAGLEGSARQELIDKRIRGEPGSTVRITVARGQESPREVDIVRNDVHRPAVKWLQFLDDKAGLAYLWLSDFHPDSDRAVLAALDELAKGPTQLNGLVLDLRFNGGGYLDACVAIANLFLREGVITTVKKRGDATESEYRAVPELCRFPDLPLVILVNQDSASASEVLTGALQDHGRALVVGELTYGKGMVNTLFSYKKLDFKLKVTTGHYVTPKGRNLEGHFDRAFRGDKKGGIVPDREVALDGEALRRAYAALNDHEPPPEFRAAVAELCRANDLRAPGILPASEDPQLQAAVTSLRERVAAAQKAK